MVAGGVRVIVAGSAQLLPRTGGYISAGAIAKGPPLVGPHPHALGGHAGKLESRERSALATALSPRLHLRQGGTATGLVEGLGLLGDDALQAAVSTRGKERISVRKRPRPPCFRRHGGEALAISTSSGSRLASALVGRTRFQMVQAHPTPAHSHPATLLGQHRLLKKYYYNWQECAVFRVSLRSALLRFVDVPQRIENV